VSKHYPWFKFFPGDFQSHTGLRMLGLEARGLCIELLCLMHKGEPRGYLRIKGHSPTSKELAAILGIVRNKDIERLLEQLLKVGVFSRGDDGTIYSPRMVWDEERAAIGREFAGRRRAASEGVPSGEPLGSPRVGPSTQNPESKDQNLEARSNRSELASLRSHRAGKHARESSRGLSATAGSLIAASLPKARLHPNNPIEDESTQDE
jgi:hypothetical protein